MHLFKLRRSAAQRAVPGRTRRRPWTSPTVAAAARRLDPTPAFVLGPAGDVLAANRAWETIVRPLGMLDGAAPNLVRFVFLDARARDVYPEWDAVADEQVAALRQAGVRAGRASPSTR